MRNILFCLFLIFSLFLIADASEKDKVMKISQQIFGDPIDPARNLFNVNRFYVYRVDFDKNNRASKLAIEPKYNFDISHPDWEETEDFRPLTFNEYKNLLEKLELVKTKGNLLSQDQINDIGNATRFHNAYYKLAQLIIGFVFKLDDNENNPAEIRFFQLNFRKDRRKKSSIKPIKIRE